MPAEFQRQVDAPPPYVVTTGAEQRLRRCLGQCHNVNTSIACRVGSRNKPLSGISAQPLRLSKIDDCASGVVNGHSAFGVSQFSYMADLPPSSTAAALVPLSSNNLMTSDEAPLLAARSNGASSPPSLEFTSAPPSNSPLASKIPTPPSRNLQEQKLAQYPARISGVDVVGATVGVSLDRGAGGLACSLRSRAAGTTASGCGAGDAEVLQLRVQTHIQK